MNAPSMSPSTAQGLRHQRIKQAALAFHPQFLREGNWGRKTTASTSVEAVCETVLLGGTACLATDANSTSNDHEDAFHHKWLVVLGLHLFEALAQF